MSRIPRIPFPLLLGFAAGLAMPAGADWSRDPAMNLPLADRFSEQVLPMPAATPDGGCYVGWFDLASGNYDVYLQRLDRRGREMWPHNGIRVSDHAQSSSLVAWDLMTDSHGNAILVFSDTRAGNDLDIHAYKVAPDGEFLWGSDGVTLSTNDDFEPGASVTEATDGDLVFTWARLPETGPGTIRLQRLSPMGLERYAHNGLAIVSPAAESPAFPDVVPSRDGSVIVSWVRDISQYTSPRHIRAQRFAAGGDAVWGAPVNIFDATAIPMGYDPGIQSDGAGGLVCTWHASMGNLHSSRFQHVDAQGIELLAHNGVAVSTVATHHIDPTLAYHPGRGEAFIFWNERNPNQSLWGIYGQRLSADGTRLWGDGGAVLMPVNTICKHYPRAVPCAGGAMVFVADEPVQSHRQRLVGMRIDETAAMVWPGSPIEISTVVSQKARYPVIINDQEMAVLVWEDNRAGTVDLYAQNVNADGTLGIDPSGIAAGDAGIRRQARAARLRGWPSLFRGQVQLALTGAAEECGGRLSIQDPLGRVVRTLALGERAAGEWRCVWDGTDARGVRLPAGVYVCTDRAAGSPAGAVRIVLLD